MTSSYLDLPRRTEAEATQARIAQVKALIATMRDALVREVQPLGGQRAVEKVTDYMDELAGEVLFHVEQSTDEQIAELDAAEDREELRQNRSDYYNGLGVVTGGGL